MSDLTDFLLARIAEDEEVARAAGPAPWIHARNEESVLDFQAHRVTPVRTEHANNVHVHLWAPTRVLAECETKRRIVELATEHERLRLDQRHEGSATALHDVLQLLAQPYASHSDYSEDWQA